MKSVNNSYRFFKLLLVVPLVSLFLFLLFGWFLIEFKKDWIKEELLLVLNENFNGDIVVEKLTFDPFTYFPKAAVQLKNVSFFENKNHVNKAVMTVDELSLDINIKQLVNEAQLIIERATAEKVKLHLVENTTEWNIERVFSVNNNSNVPNRDVNTAFVLAVDELKVKIFEFSILPKGSKDSERIHFEKVKANLTYENHLLQVKLNSHQHIYPTLFNTYDIPSIGKTLLNADFLVDLSRDKIEVSKASLDLDTMKYNFHGTYSFQDFHKIETEFEGRSIQDPEKLTKGKFTTVFGTPIKSLGLLLETNKIDIGETLNKYETDQFAKGDVTIKVDWSFKGKTYDSFIQHSRASVQTYGRNISLSGMDLDELLENYKRSQNFSLVDVGAYAFVGPFGAIAVKGSDFTKLLRTKFTDVDSTQIQEIIFDVNLADGVISTNDVAFSTNSNRLAFFGDIDIVNDSIPNGKLVVLSEDACEVLSQRFYGSFDAVKIEEVKVVKTLMGSVVNLVQVLTFQKCKPVYSGKIVHPVSEGSKRVF
ncbi:hypothetical protein [Flavicella marina]|uniref:hypothetical protein n=1 Tax=Flavicella marina TaxID=1475951 RepID=UPI0012643A46|nr:hypothetical protein [Flavicella marina]